MASIPKMRMLRSHENRKQDASLTHWFREAKLQFGFNPEDANTEIATKSETGCKLDALVPGSESTQSRDLRMLRVHPEILAGNSHDEIWHGGK